MKNKIIDLIFKEPEKWIHLREVARRLKISPNSVRKYIAELKKKRIVEIKQEANMILFRANMESETYRHEKLIHNLKSIYDSSILDLLYRYYNPKAIVLFGSYSRGEQKDNSDVDIAVDINDKNMSLLGFIGLIRLLEDALKRKVDLVEYKTIKPRIKERVLSEEIRII